MKIYHHEKDAAKAALRAINPVSIKENVEYVLVIYRSGKVYGATQAFTSNLATGVREQDVQAALDARPRGSVAVAYCHTHGADVPGIPSLTFTSDDLALARRLRINAYLATPSHEFVTYLISNPKSVFPREPLGD